MKYRVFKEYDDELVVITENGRIGSVRWAEPIEEGDDRKSTAEWYDTPFLEVLNSQLGAVLKCPIEDLPKYLNTPGYLAQEVLQVRLKGEEPPESFSYYLWQWLADNSKAYYEDFNTEFDDPEHISFILDELVGLDPNTLERDDTLFKEYF
jgi:hypothetical protein